MLEPRVALAWALKSRVVFPRALVMGPFYSGGVCSMGPYVVHVIYLICMESRSGVHTKGP